jgi:hypothetical protein
MKLVQSFTAPKTLDPRLLLQKTALDYKLYSYIWNMKQHQKRWIPGRPKTRKMDPRWHRAPWARNFKILGTEFQKVEHGIFKIWARLFYRIETPHLEFLPVLFLNRSTILPLVFLNGRKYGIFVLFLFCIVSSQKIIKYVWVDVQICSGGCRTKQYGFHTEQSGYHTTQYG